jgi:hypothetical protein
LAFNQFDDLAFQTRCRQAPTPPGFTPPKGPGGFYVDQGVRQGASHILAPAVTLGQAENSSGLCRRMKSK